ncbi:MAG TPA: hypothetical protein VFW52_00620 [Candidatus Saccharimonadales bacterium]|nr:hypothetical protein [Candidatus Saccharimonadales bacterium]
MERLDEIIREKITPEQEDEIVDRAIKRLGEASLHIAPGQQKTLEKAAKEE